MALEFEQSTLQALFNITEYQLFQRIIHEVCGEYRDIDGFLLTGSMVQKLNLPVPPKKVKEPPLSSAYEKIVGRSRRKLFPHLDSDLDIWILTKESNKNPNIERELDERALSLLDWYSGQSDVSLVDWIDKKHKAFDEFYKKPSLYSKEWNSLNDTPWNADHFKRILIERMDKHFPQLQEKVNYYFNRRFEYDFFEVRAYSASVFNLRPEKITLGDKVDRTPFAYFMKDWLNLENNCLIVYQNEDGTDLIYPFDPHGTVLGKAIASRIKWTPHHVEYVKYNNGRKD